MVFVGYFSHVLGAARLGHVLKQIVHSRPKTEKFMCESSFTLDGLRIMQMWSTANRKWSQHMLFPRYTVEWDASIRWWIWCYWGVCVLHSAELIFRLMVCKFQVIEYKLPWEEQPQLIDFPAIRYTTSSGCSDIVVVIGEALVRKENEQCFD